MLTDSGTVQEECAILGVPVVTLRDSTERPETIEAGTNFISGCEPEAILRGVNVVTTFGMGEPPYEYLAENVSDTVVKGPTPVALFTGVTDVTTGGVVSEPAAVVNVKLAPDTALPSKSRICVL